MALDKVTPQQRSDDTNDKLPFEVGQRVYCPTFGGYGAITELRDSYAIITMIGMYGIGRVEIKHGDYERSKYQKEQGVDQSVYSMYEAYCQKVWEIGAEALTYHDWLQVQVAGAISVIQVVERINKATQT